MRTLITICARGGSKGIPGKNIKNLGGKPLIYYTLKTAATFAAKNGNIDIYLSTDSQEIKDVVRELNIDLIKTNYERPAFLATDSSGKLQVIKDVLEFAEDKNGIEYKHIIDLDVTSPLRTVEDLELALDKLIRDTKAYNIFSVNLADRNPYFNMVEHREESEYVKLVKEGSFVTRQGSPTVYDMNASFYIWRRDFFDLALNNNITESTLVYTMPHICFDLDHPLDFEFMAFLIQNQKLDFKFIV